VIEILIYIFIGFGGRNTYIFMSSNLQR